MAKYSLMGVKTGIGHDLNGVQGTIKRGGKKIVEVVDDGFGGERDVYWLVDEDKQEQYTNEITPFMETMAENEPKDYMKEAILGKKWVWFFEHLLKLHLDAKDTKKVAKRWDLENHEAVWKVICEGPSAIQRGNSYLIALPKELDEDDALAMAQEEIDDEKVEKVVMLAADSVMEI